MATIKIKLPVWVTANGVHIPVEEMTPSHIRNTIRCLEGRGGIRIPDLYIEHMGGRDRWLKILNTELDRRFGKPMKITMEGVVITTKFIAIPKMEFEVLSYYKIDHVIKTPGELHVDDVVIQQHYKTGTGNEQALERWVKQTRFKTRMLYVNTWDRHMVFEVRPRSYVRDAVNKAEEIIFIVESVIKDISIVPKDKTKTPLA